MTSLYLLRSTTDRDQYVITKLDGDYEVEGVYGVSATECSCPAGARPTCRHRKMLPFFLQHKHVDDGWFLDWDTRLWRKPLGEPLDGTTTLTHDNLPAFGRSPAMAALPDLKAINELPPEVRARANAEFVENHLIPLEALELGASGGGFPQSPGPANYVGHPAGLTIEPPVHNILIPLGASVSDTRAPGPEEEASPPPSAPPAPASVESLPSTPGVGALPSGFVRKRRV